jgi:hypothetical protein
MSTYSEDKKSDEARDESVENARLDSVKRTANGLKLEPQPSDNPEGKESIIWYDKPH